MSSRFLIADFLSSLMNRCRSSSAKAIVVDSNKLCKEVAIILADAGYISEYKIEKIGSCGRAKLTVYPRFIKRDKSAISIIKLVSKPGRRVYVSAEELRLMLLKDSFSTFIISSSSGVVTAARALELGVGGEFVCSIF